LPRPAGPPTASSACSRSSRRPPTGERGTPDHEEVVAEGTLAGTIAGARRGTGGFGYDPVFVPEGEEQTVAELGDAWKTANSHRARAATALAAALSQD